MGWAEGPRMRGPALFAPLDATRDACRVGKSGCGREQKRSWLQFTRYELSFRLHHRQPFWPWELAIRMEAARRDPDYVCLTALNLDGDMKHTNKSKAGML